MSRRSDSEKAQEWRRRLARFERSGLSAYEFCQDEGISTASFYQWRKRLTSGGGCVGGTDREDGGAVGFAAVRVVGSPGIEVRFPGGTQMQIPLPGPESLPKLIHMIARVDADVAGDEAC